MLVINGGDAFYDRAPATRPERALALERARLVARAYRRLALDAFVPGDQDLALGLSSFTRLARAQEIPVVAANLRDRRGHRPFPGFLRKEIGGLRILIIGLVDPDSWPVDGALRAQDPLTAAQQIIESVARPGDLVVLATHLPLDAAADLAQVVPRAAVVTAAEQQSLSFYPREVPRAAGEEPRLTTPVFSAGNSGQHLARLLLSAFPAATHLAGGQQYDEAHADCQQLELKLARGHGGEVRDALGACRAQLARLDHLSSYLYELVDLDARFAEDVETAAWRKELREKAL